MRIRHSVYVLCTLVKNSFFLSFSALLLIKHSLVQDLFATLGLPKILMIPLAFLILLSLSVILLKKRGISREWAYAFLVNILLAINFGFIMSDSQWLSFSVITLALTVLSRFMEAKMFRDTKQLSTILSFFRLKSHP